MTQNIKKIVIIAVAVLFVILVIANCFTIVDAGHTGVVVTLGKVSSNVFKPFLASARHASLPAWPLPTTTAS